MHDELNAKASKDNSHGIDTGFDTRDPPAS
jgi:hypothetical protein